VVLPRRWDRPGRPFAALGATEASRTEAGGRSAGDVVEPDHILTLKRKRAASVCSYHDDVVILVGRTRFELGTCSTQNCRATRLRYTPINAPIHAPGVAASAPAAWRAVENGSVPGRAAARSDAAQNRGRSTTALETVRFCGAALHAASRRDTVEMKVNRSFSATCQRGLNSGCATGRRCVPYFWLSAITSRTPSQVRSEG